MRTLNFSFRQYIEEVVYKRKQLHFVQHRPECMEEVPNVGELLPRICWPAVVGVGVPKPFRANFSMSENLSKVMKGNEILNLWESYLLQCLNVALNLLIMIYANLYISLGSQQYLRTNLKE